MNERQQAHVTYFPERVGYWRSFKRDYWAARMPAAMDAVHSHRLRSEEEGIEMREMNYIAGPQLTVLWSVMR